MTSAVTTAYNTVASGPRTAEEATSARAISLPGSRKGDERRIWAGKPETVLLGLATRPDSRGLRPMALRGIARKQSWWYFLFGLIVGVSQGVLAAPHELQVG